MIHDTMQYAMERLTVAFRKLFSVSRLYRFMCIFDLCENKNKKVKTAFCSKIYLAIVHTPHSRIATCEYFISRRILVPRNDPNCSLLFRIVCFKRFFCWLCEIDTWPVSFRMIAANPLITFRLAIYEIWIILIKHYL